MSDFGPMLTDADGDGDPDNVDCNDGSAAILSPRDDLNVTANYTFCPGMFYLSDGGLTGVIRFNPGNLTITCNGTTIIGNSSGIGYFVDSEENITIVNCRIGNYSYGVYVNDSIEVDLINVSSSNNTVDGVRYYASNNGTITNLNVSYNGNNGLSFYLSNNTVFISCLVWNNSGDGLNVLYSNDTLIAGLHSENNTYSAVYGVGSHNLRVFNMTSEREGYGLFASSSLNLFVFNSNFSNEGYYGVYLNASDNASLNDTRSFSNTQQGFRLVNSDSVSFARPEAYDQSIGVYLASGSDYFQLDGGNIYNNTIIGIEINSSDRANINGTMIAGNGFGGIRLDDSNYTRLSNISVHNHTRGLYLIGSHNASVYNSSFFDNSYGVLLATTSTANVFYYNNFSNNLIIHMNASVAGNQFNTSVGGVAQGNYWDDIDASQLYIFDTNLDGWGDSGTDYPYNSSNRGNVSKYVQDFGPKIADSDGDGSPDWQDCADNNATILPPYDDLNISENKILCPGTYQIDDEGKQGVIYFGTGDATVTCNATVIIGNTSGYGIYASGVNNVTIIGCNLSRYNESVYISSTPNATLVNLSVSNNSQFGVRVRLNSHHAVLSNVLAWNNTDFGVYIINSDNVSLDDVQAWNTGGDGLKVEYSDNASLVNVSVWNNGRYGIFVYYSRNATIVDAQVRGSADRGIYLWGSGNSSVRNSTVYANLYNIYLASADDVLLDRIVATDSASYSVVVSGSNRANISNAKVRNASNGFRIISSNYTSLRNVNSSNTTYGIYVFSSNNLDVRRALFRNNTYQGYYYNSNDAVLDRVVAENSSNYGFNFSTAYRTNISNTIVSNSGQGGFYLSLANNSRLYNVTAENNSLSGFLIGTSPNLNLVQVASRFNSQYGFSVSNSGYSTWMYIDVLHNSNDGINMTGSNNTNITNTTLSFNEGDGLYYVGSNDMRFINMTIRNNTGDGLKTVATSGGFMKRVTVFNNSIGIDIPSSSNINLTLLDVQNNTGYGIYLSSGSNHSINNSYFAGNNVSIFAEGADKIDIYRVTIKDSVSHGVYLSQNDSYNLTHVSVSDSGDDALHFEDAQDVDLFNITVLNADYGVYLRVSNKSTLKISTIEGVNVGVVYNQSNDGIMYFNFINGSQYGLLVDNASSAGNNNISLNHFYVSGVNDTSGNMNSYCINHTWDDLTEGNFYEIIIPWALIGHDDCGPVNVTEPEINFSVMVGTQIVNVSWKNQSSILPITYDVEFTNNSGADWYPVSDDITDNNASYNISQQHWTFDAYFRVTPYDTRVNGTQVWSYKFAIHPPCDIYNSNVTGSEFWNYSWLSRPCRIVNSTVTYSNITNSVIINSTINHSILYESYVSNSSFNNSNISFSEIQSARFCAGFGIYGAAILGNTLSSGMIRYNATDYFAPALLTQICNASVPPYDPTPPTAPTVYDGTASDVDWFNTNTTLSANWEGATEDMSTIYYRYVIRVNGTACLTGYCNFIGIGTSMNVTITNVNLSEGSNYSFVVQAYNSYGGSAANASSDGAVLDITNPGTPSISSPTHPDQNLNYTGNDPEFEWNSTDPISSMVASGIIGYSYLLDQDKGSAPDDILEDRYKTTLLDNQNGGYFQVLRANSSDTSTYAVFQQVRTNLTQNQTVYVTIDLFEHLSEQPDMNNFEVYAIDVTPTSYDMKSDRVTEIEHISTDLGYVSDTSQAKSYELELTMNETVPNSIFIVVAGLSNDSNRNNYSIAGTNTSANNNTRTYVCKSGGSCTEMTQSVDYAVKAETSNINETYERAYDNLADGTYWFHVKAKDFAGNFGPVGHFNITIVSGTVSVSVTDPFDGQVFNNDTITADVYASTNSTVYLIALHPDGSNYTSEQQNFTGTSTFAGVTLEQGVNRLFAKAKSLSNNETVYSSYVYVTYSPLTVANKSLVITYSQAGSAPSSSLMLKDTGTYTVGLASENPQSSTTSSSISSDTDFYTTKIFMTFSGIDSAGVISKLDDDELLDMRQPSFGFNRKKEGYIIAAQLRYKDIFLSGSNNTQSGTYSVKMINLGLTEDGRQNITLIIT
ncbi:MAG: right-handed parallel beta-helix repeat-containing protein [Candidatus Nanoarchaeia archaeon]